MVKSLLVDTVTSQVAASVFMRLGGACVDRLFLATLVIGA